MHHSGPISGIAAFAGTYVATAGYDNQVILWDAASKRPLSRSVHDHLANQVSFSPDGAYLLTSSSDYTARLWSLPDLKLVSVLSDHEDDVEMSVFHPAEPLIATASRDHHVRVYGFDGSLKAVFEGHTADVISVEWSPDGKELISSSDDGTVKRWSLATGTMVKDVDLGGVETDTVALASTGTVYAGNDDGEIVVVEETGTTAHPAHDAGIKRLVYNAARELIVSLSYDRKLRVWDVSGQDLREVASSSLPSDVWPRSCAFLDDTTLVFATFGSSYATYDIAAEEWDLAGVEPTFGVNAVLRHQGSTLTIGDAGLLWRDGREVARTGSLCNFLTAVGDRVLTGGQMGTVFDALTGSPVHQHRSPLNCGAAFDRAGRRHVVIGTYTGEGLVFSLGDDGAFTLEATLPLHANAVKGVATAGGVIFSVSADAEAAWFSTETLEEIARVPEAHDKIANGCAGTATGEFVSISRDLKLRIWTGGTADVVDTPHDHSIKSISTSADGRYIATGGYNGLVALHDRATGEWPVVVRPTTAGISSICFDGDGDRFLAGSYDGSVYPVEVPS
ncbi:WD40 repeat domain-containing protein [Streptomyces sp. NPDC047002]|uniref:WD40 repeat domain-containing protein n=1 Tax=Streptomyces sp. NPDC047002 TaxID=3155475 RepID=UPI0034527D6B